MGVDECIKGFRAHWPDKRTATERNVYHNNACSPVDRLEGDDWEFFEMTTSRPAPSTSAPILSTSTPTQTTKPPPPIDNDPRPESPASASEGQLSEEEVLPAKRIRKPSKRLADILAGCSVNSTRPSGPTGVQVPPAPIPVVEGEGMADWIMAADFPEEYAMATEISEVEALEPRPLAEAKQRPDRSLWGEDYQAGTGSITRRRHLGTHRRACWSRYRRLQMGFPSEE